MDHIACAKCQGKFAKYEQDIKDLYNICLKHAKTLQELEPIAHSALEEGSTLSGKNKALEKRILYLEGRDTIPGMDYRLDLNEVKAMIDTSVKSIREMYALQEYRMDQIMDNFHDPSQPEDETIDRIKSLEGIMTHHSKLLGESAIKIKNIGRSLYNHIHEGC